MQLLGAVISKFDLTTQLSQLTLNYNEGARLFKRQKSVVILLKLCIHGALLKAKFGPLTTYLEKVEYGRWPELVKTFSI